MTIIVSRCDNCMTLLKKTAGPDDEKATDGMFFPDDTVSPSQTSVLTQGVAIAAVQNLAFGAAAQNRMFNLCVTPNGLSPWIFQIDDDALNTFLFIISGFSSSANCVSLRFTHNTQQINFQLLEAPLGATFNYKASYGLGQFLRPKRFIG